MSSKPKILAFSGSLRSGSFNQKLVGIAAQGATDAGAEVTILRLSDYPLPVFDQDLEGEGVPENALKLKQVMLDHDGLLIASPEYNSSVTAALKNAIDWVSRPAEGETPLAAFKNKVAAIMSASPGGLGGLRGLVHLRAILGNIGVLVVPDQVAIPNAHAAFGENGGLSDERKHSSVAALGGSVVRLVEGIAD